MAKQPKQKLFPPKIPKIKYHKQNQKSISNWEEIFSNYITDEWLIFPKIYRVHKMQGKKDQQSNERRQSQLEYAKLLSKENVKATPKYNFSPVRLAYIKRINTVLAKI